MEKKLENQIKNIRKAIHVWWFEFRGIVFSTRWLLLSVITFFLVKFYLNEFVFFARTYELGIYPAALISLFTDIGFVSLGMLILIFMMSVFPIVNHLQQNVLLRSGNRIWVNGQMLTMITMALLWIVEIQVFICIIFGKNLDFSGWGKAWGTAATGKLVDYGVASAVTISSEVIQGYTPLQAVLTSALFVWMMAIIYGEIIFCVDGLCNNYVGEIILTVWSLMWLIVGNFHMLEEVPIIKKLSPQNWLDISRYVNNPSKFAQSLGMMLGVILIFYIINRILIHKKIIAVK